MTLDAQDKGAHDRMSDRIEYLNEVHRLVAAGVLTEAAGVEAVQRYDEGDPRVGTSAQDEKLIAALSTTPPPGFPILGDSSDRDIKLASGKRIGGATAEEWIELIRKAPDRTLPGGVAGMLVEHIDRVTRDSVTLSEEIGRVVEETKAPDPFSVAQHVRGRMADLDNATAELRRVEGALCVARAVCLRALPLRQFRVGDIPLGAVLSLDAIFSQLQRVAYGDEGPKPSPEFEDAIAWHLYAVRLGSKAQSTAHVQAILDHFGWKP